MIVLQWIKLWLLDRSLDRFGESLKRENDKLAWVRKIYGDCVPRGTKS